MSDLFLELLRIALGTQTQLSRCLTDDEWIEMFNISQKQSVVGIAFSGIEKMPKEQRPCLDLLMDWSGVVDYIEKENRKLNMTSVKACEIFHIDSINMCILKGQGLGSLYPNPLRRSSGDVDVWMEGDRKDVEVYMAKYFPNREAGHLHVSTILNNGVDMEVHHGPIDLFEPKRNKILKDWIDSQRDMQWNKTVNVIVGTDSEKVGTVNVPTWEFNLVYVLIHLFIHFIIEGVGMKQIIDYYYLLDNEGRYDGSNIDVNRKTQILQNTEKLLKRLGLREFSGALMWVMKQMGLNRTKMICEPDEKLGRKMMTELLNTGTVSCAEIIEKRSTLIGKCKSIIHRLVRVWKMHSLAPKHAIWIIVRNAKNVLD